MGTRSQRRRDEIHLFHLPPPRRLFHVRHQTIGLQRGESNPVQTRRGQRTRRSLPKARAETIPVLLAYRLASSRLLPLGTYRAQHGAHAFRDMGRLPEIHGCPTHRTAHKLRFYRGYLVRRLVGQTGCRLATGKAIRFSPPPATGVPHR